jgi:hypothetical protein
MRLEMTEKFLEVMGDFSLVGALVNMYGFVPSEVELVFFESIREPDMIVVPEYVPRLLVEQVIELATKCKLTIVRETRAS